MSASGEGTSSELNLFEDIPTGGACTDNGSVLSDSYYGCYYSSLSDMQKWIKKTISSFR